MQLLNFYLVNFYLSTRNKLQYHMLSHQKQVRLSGSTTYLPLTAPISSNDVLICVVTCLLSSSASDYKLHEGSISQRLEAQQRSVK